VIASFSQTFLQIYVVSYQRVTTQIKTFFIIIKLDAFFIYISYFFIDNFNIIYLDYFSDGILTVSEWKLIQAVKMRDTLTY
jgi:hypothetical protein